MLSLNRIASSSISVENSIIEENRCIFIKKNRINSVLFVSFKSFSLILGKEFVKRII